MTRRRKKPLKKGKSQARSVPPYPHEFRLKVARLYVEDGYPAKLVASQFGISDYSVYTWEKKYREHGEQGLIEQSSKNDYPPTCEFTPCFIYDNLLGGRQLRLIDCIVKDWILKI